VTGILLGLGCWLAASVLTAAAYCTVKTVYQRWHT
jgi:hypothetical protein